MLIKYFSIFVEVKLRNYNSIEILLIFNLYKTMLCTGNLIYDVLLCG